MFFFERCSCSFLFHKIEKKPNLSAEIMSESGDESSVSENNWPMNEEWLIGILKRDDQTDGMVKINVKIVNKTIES